MSAFLAWASGVSESVRAWQYMLKVFGLRAKKLKRSGC